jgi:hypothetical protein
VMSGTAWDAAASTHDPELVVFHYSRLATGGALCHAAYARARFPGSLLLFNRVIITESTERLRTHRCT